jgi:hypothetical protein
VRPEIRISDSFLVFYGTQQRLISNIMFSDPAHIRRIWFWSILASIAYLALLVAGVGTEAAHLGTWLFAGLIMLFSAWAGWKNRSVLLATIGVMAGLLAWHYEAAMHCETVFNRQSWTVHMIAFAVLVTFSLPASLLQRKRTRTWYRWIFARAAEHADDGSGSDAGESDAGESDATARNGNRTCPVRSAEYSTEELRRFGRFMGDRRIAVPHWEGDALMLFLPGAHALYRMRGFEMKRTSCVTFHEDGRITARITQEDYLPQRDHVPYPVLCRGVGDVMYDFLQRQRLGEEDLILREVHDDTQQAEKVLTIIGMLVYLLAVLLYFGIL